MKNKISTLISKLNDAHDRALNMSDTNALVAGIRLQNEKYEKLLNVMKRIAYYNHDVLPDPAFEARRILKEIGEE